MVEPRVPQRTWSEGEVDLRVSALSRASQRILTRLGVWGRVMELGASPYREMVVWEGLGRGRIRFEAADLGEPDLGHIVENRVTQLALWERLEATADVTLSCPARVEEIDFKAKDLSRDLRDGVRLARLVDALQVRRGGEEVETWVSY